MFFCVASGGVPTAFTYMKDMKHMQPLPFQFYLNSALVRYVLMPVAMEIVGRQRVAGPIEDLLDKCLFSDDAAGRAPPQKKQGGIGWLRRIPSTETWAVESGSQERFVWWVSDAEGYHFDRISETETKDLKKTKDFKKTKHPLETPVQRVCTRSLSTPTKVSKASPEESMSVQKKKKTKIFTLSGSTMRISSLRAKAKEARAHADKIKAFIEHRAKMRT